MQTLHTLKTRLAALLTLAALALALLAPAGKAEAGYTNSADGLGFDNPQVSWNSGPR